MEGPFLKDAGAIETKECVCLALYFVLLLVYFLGRDRWQLIRSGKRTGATGQVHRTTKNEPNEPVSIVYERKSLRVPI